MYQDVNRIEQAEAHLRRATSHVRSGGASHAREVREPGLHSYRSLSELNPAVELLLREVAQLRAEVDELRSQRSE